MNYDWNVKSSMEQFRPIKNLLGKQVSMIKIIQEVPAHFPKRYYPIK